MIFYEWTITHTDHSESVATTGTPESAAAGIGGDASRMKPGEMMTVCVIEGQDAFLQHCLSKLKQSEAKTEDEGWIPLCARCKQPGVLNAGDMHEHCHAREARRIADFLDAEANELYSAGLYRESDHSTWNTNSQRTAALQYAAVMLRELYPGDKGEGE